MTFKPAALGLALGLLLSTSALASEAIHVMKTASCGCCHEWVERLEDAGYRVRATDMSYGELVEQKIKAGLTRELASCHTAEVGGYVVEGHVPAREIARLLDERPDAIGLAVPGMPLGSPGMDLGDGSEPYDVLLVKKDGSTEVYASY